MTDGLKVLQIVHGFPPHDQAGTEIYTQTLGRALLKRDEIASVSVFARKGDPDRPEYEIEKKTVDGMDIYWINNNYQTIRKMEDLYINPSIEAALEPLLKELKPDIFHIQHLIGLSLGCVDLALQYGAKAVLTFPDFWYQCALGQRFPGTMPRCDKIDHEICAKCFGWKQKKYLADTVRDRLKKRDGGSIFGLPKLIWNQRRNHMGTKPFKRREEQMSRMLNSLHAIIGPSQFILDEYKNYYNLNGPELIYSDYGMVQDWVSGMPERDSSAEKICFGFVGSFLPSKGIELLIKAFNPIDHPKAQLHLYGKAPSHMKEYDQKLRDLSKNPNIIFHGPFDNARLAEVMAKIHMLVIPSIWFENSPLTLHEAALVDIPVLTSNLGGMKEFVERYGNGLLFQPDDEQDLRAKILEVADNPSVLEGLAKPKLQVKTPAEDAAEMVILYKKLIANNG